MFNGHFDHLNEIASRRFSLIEILKKKRIDEIKKVTPAYIRITSQNVNSTLLTNLTSEIQLEYNKTIHEHLNYFLNNEKNFTAVFKSKLKVKEFSFVFLFFF